MPQQKKKLDALYKSFDFRARAPHDPISIPMRYKKARDIEVSAFIAASYAYGRVDLFLPVLETITSIIGRSPYRFIMEFDLRKHGRLFDGISYRFNKPADLVGLIYAIRGVLNEFGSLEGAFMVHSSKDDPDIGPGLGGLMSELKQAGRGAFRSRKPEGFSHYFPSPVTGGAAKRGALFMRWMVRRKDIDFGIWKGISPSKLVIPLDVHIARVSRCLGLTTRKSNDWKTALEITASLRKLDPRDPMKYDFALCHRGISGLCAPGACTGCGLRETGKQS
jgi:uncharacterized protein (TIGR02757 family)